VEEERILMIVNMKIDINMKGELKAVGIELEG